MATSEIILPWRRSMMFAEQFKYKKIQIIGLPRTGGSYFMSALNDVISAGCKHRFNTLGEPIGHETHSEITTYLKLIKDKNIIVVKHLVNQFESLLNYPNYHNVSDRFYNIGIIRRNIFDLALSLCVAKHTKQYSDYTYNNDTKIKLDKHEFISCLFSQINLWEQLEAQLPHYNEIVYYEDLTFIPIIDFSNLKFNKVSLPSDTNENLSKLEDFHAPDKSDVVINYNELYETTLRFLENYYNPYIRVNGVNFEFRNTNSQTVANRERQGTFYHRSY